MYLQSHMIIFFLDQFKNNKRPFTPCTTQRPEVFLWSTDHIQHMMASFQHQNAQKFPECKQLSWKKKEYNSLPSSKLECHLSIWKIQEQIQNETLIPSETHKKRKLFIWSKTQISPSWNYLGMSQDTKFPGASFSVIGASCGNIKLLVNNKNIT